jgi:hypothetical protein
MVARRDSARRREVSPSNCIAFEGPARRGLSKSLNADFARDRDGEGARLKIRSLFSGIAPIIIALAILRIMSELRL